MPIARMARLSRVEPLSIREAMLMAKKWFLVAASLSVEYHSFGMYCCVPSWQYFLLADWHDMYLLSDIWHSEQRTLQSTKLH